jgi:hypothetical protein
VVCRKKINLTAELVFCMMSDINVFASYGYIVSAEYCLKIMAADDGNNNNNNNFT